MSLPERVTLNGKILDRRVFLGALGLTAAGTALVLAGAGARAPRETTLGAAAIPEGTGHVDDMWGHWPRYAHPIPYTVARDVPISWDTVAPVDRVFVA